VASRVSHSVFDAGSARVQSRWAEWAWSSFFGTAVELRSTGADGEWLPEEAADWQIEINGEPRTTRDAQPLEWSDVATPFSIGVVAQYTGTAVTITVETHALHTKPGFLRRMTFLNRIHEPVVLDSVWPLRLPLEFEAATGRDPDLAVEILAVHDTGSNGWLMFGGSEFTLDRTVDSCYTSARWGDEARVLESGKQVTSPNLWLVPYNGGFDAATDRSRKALREIASAWDDWTRERLARAQADEA